MLVNGHPQHLHAHQARRPLGQQRILLWKPRGVGALAFVGAEHDDCRHDGGFGSFRVSLHWQTPGVKKRSRKTAPWLRWLSSVSGHRHAAAASSEHALAAPGPATALTTTQLAERTGIVNTVLYQTSFAGANERSWGRPGKTRSGSHTGRRFAAHCRCFGRLPRRIPRSQPGRSAESTPGKSDCRCARRGPAQAAR